MVEVAKVIAMLWKEYGKLPLIGHRDVVATACPGRWYDKLEKLAEMAEVIYGGGELPETEEKKSIVLGEYDTLREADDYLGALIEKLDYAMAQADLAKLAAADVKNELLKAKVVG
jgi:hypothetical protein